jgi:hypothetical protein
MTAVWLVAGANRGTGPEAVGSAPARPRAQLAAA